MLILHEVCFRLLNRHPSAYQRTTLHRKAKAADSISLPLDQRLACIYKIMVMQVRKRPDLLAVRSYTLWTVE